VCCIIGEKSVVGGGNELFSTTRPATPFLPGAPMSELTCFFKLATPPPTSSAQAHMYVDIKRFGCIEAIALLMSLLRSHCCLPKLLRRRKTPSALLPIPIPQWWCLIVPHFVQEGTICPSSEGAALERRMTHSTVHPSTDVVRSPNQVPHAAYRTIRPSNTRSPGPHSGTTRPGASSHVRQSLPLCRSKTHLCTLGRKPPQVGTVYTATHGM